MKRTALIPLCLSLALAIAGSSGQAFGGKHEDAAARAAQMQQRQAAEAQRHAREGQHRAADAFRRDQDRRPDEGRHAFFGHPGGSGLNAAQACAMFFGRC